MLKIFKWLGFGKKEKVPPPDVYAIIKINDVAKEQGQIFGDVSLVEMNKIIEKHTYGKIKTSKYSDAEVESLREQGIPVIDEEYSDEYKFFESPDGSGGGVEFKR